MINVSTRILNAWYQLLGGHISVPVYRYEAPPTEEGNYVVLRVESDTNTPNKQRFFNNPVVITDVVTRFRGGERINDELAQQIDEEIGVLLFGQPVPTVKHNLPDQDDIQILSVERQSATYLPENDGTDRYLRIVTRNVHRVEQLINES
jgi:hypothetical protein